jgi:hypothetical protein
MFWLRDINPLVCRRLQDFARQVSDRQRARRTAVLSISLPGTQAPSPEARAALAELIKDTDRCVTRVAVVREGQGFVSSVVASVIVGIQMISRAQSAHKPFPSADEALRWVTAELVEFRIGEIRIEDALAAVEQQRKSLQTRYRSAS